MLIECAGVRLVAKTTRRTPRSIAWLRRVHERARAVGFVVPTLLPSRQGQLIVEGITVEQWIEGVPASRVEREEATPLLQAFHEATRGWPQRPGFASSLALLRAWQGGDVNLASMPEDLVRLCRSSWRELASEPVSVVHGDLNPQNALRTPDGRLALIDWDEARVDVSILDEVAFSAPRIPIDEERWARGAWALKAWEVAVCWHTEPEYARRLAADLRFKAGT